MRMIQHSAYELPRRRLLRALENHRPGHMVFVIGPSGVGKTTMRRSAMQEMFGDPSYWGRGRTPAVETFAMLPNGAYFSSRELAKSLLDELQAPTLSWLLEGSNIPENVQVSIRNELAECRRVWSKLKPKRGTEGEYWGLVKRSILARGCKYIALDQVTALLVNHRDTSPADHTLHLMALAEASGVMFVMTGVQSAVRLWEVHSELRRRVLTVWMPPYSDGRPEDWVPFLRVLQSLSLKYNLSKQDLLTGMAHDILAATGGVFAQIVQLLDRAHQVAYERGRDRIIKRDIQDSYYSNADLEAIWRDVKAFELAMKAGDVSQRAELARTRWRLPLQGKNDAD